MFEDSYKTIAKPAEGSYSEKRSKFLAYAFPVQNEQEVKERLAEIQKKHWDARHHCYAYILGAHKDAYRLNDNGEPSGTAGRPIYGQLLSKDVTNTLVIVVRYFGASSWESADCRMPTRWRPARRWMPPSSRSAPCRRPTA